MFDVIFIQAINRASIGYWPLHPLSIGILFLYFQGINKNRQSSLPLHMYILTYVCKHDKITSLVWQKKSNIFQKKSSCLGFYIVNTYVCCTCAIQWTKNNLKKKTNEWLGIRWYCNNIVVLPFYHCFIKQLSNVDQLCRV